MRRRLLALGGCVVLAVAACSSGSHHAAPTTTQPPPAAAASPNPAVIPPVITAAYVDAVFRVLNHINGNVSRALIAQHRLSSASIIDLRAIFGDPLFRAEVTLAQQSLDGGITNVRRPPGDVITTVSHLVSASQTCIFAQTSSDFANVLIAPGTKAASEYYRLSIKQPSTDPTDINPTPWVLSFNATYHIPTNIPNQCAE
jgi:hypothetical protein